MDTAPYQVGVYFTNHSVVRLVVRLSPLHHRCDITNAHSIAFYRFAAVVSPDQT